MPNSTHQRKPLDTRAILICVVLCFIWGLQQVAIKAASTDVSPLLQVGLRCGVSGALLYLWNRFVSHERSNPSVRWHHGLFVGLAFACEFLFVAEGLRFTTASHMSVLLYTAPLFAAIGLALRLPEERLSALQWLGLLLAFSGIGIAFLLPTLLAESVAQMDNPLWWLGDLLGLASGISWGITTVLLRTSSMNEASASQMLYWQLGIGFVVLSSAACLSGQTQITNTSLAWVSMLFQSVVVSFASYLVWCGLLRQYLAARLGVIVFMSPIFGVLLSIALLGEHVGLPFVTGSLCVLAGLVAVQGAGRLRQALSWRRIGKHRQG